MNVKLTVSCEAIKVCITTSVVEPEPQEQELFALAEPERITVSETFWNRILIWIQHKME
jgi:hypothetical protein